LEKYSTIYLIFFMFGANPPKTLCPDRVHVKMEIVIFIWNKNIFLWKYF